MGFASVYRCLQELFPQLDARLLKAIAIENSKDADAAVGVVLSQILPCMTENAISRSPLGNLGSHSRIEEEVQEGDQNSLLRRLRIVEKVNSSESKFAANADVHASSSSTDGPARPALINKALFWGDTDNSIDQSHESFSPKALAAPKTAEETRAASLNLISQAQLVAAMHHFDVAKVPEELNGTAESEEQILSGMKSKPLTSTVRTSLVATPVIPNADESDSGTGRSRTDEKGSKIAHAHSADGTREHRLGRNKSIFLPNVVCELEPVSVQKRDPDTDITEDVSAEYLNDIDIIAEASDATSTIEEVGGEEAFSITRSAQIREVDLLEQMIGDTKKSKKILSSAMASVVNTMKEVEEREKAAKQASEEAAQGSSDVCRKVEELKGMIRSAKEANDMHAGEIYGERAILATEMRELQSRLLNLSDERDGSLAILDEMRSALETRLTAAQVVIEAAECEKHAKLGSATNALKEQEALMEKMVHESKMLQAEVEKNSKLREFLMDRGRMVDHLQGEIAVICQDVKLLKERFESGAALSRKSISFGQTSCILASSSSSLNSSAPSDRVPVSSKTFKAPNEASLGSSVDRSSLRRDPEDESATGAEKKELVDDGGWEWEDEKIKDWDFVNNHLGFGFWIG